MEVKNIFQIPVIPAKTDNEIFETLFKKDNVIIERIISTGQITSRNSWYDQDKNEWVLLLQGEAIIKFENSETVKMKGGDYLFIPAHKKHKVTYTSENPCCNWLALHF